MCLIGIALDERERIVNECLCHVITGAVDPFAWNGLFFVGCLSERNMGDFTAIGLCRGAVKRDHDAACPL